MFSAESFSSALSLPSPSILPSSSILLLALLAFSFPPIGFLPCPFHYALLLSVEIQLMPQLFQSLRGARVCTRSPLVRSNHSLSELLTVRLLITYIPPKNTKSASSLGQNILRCKVQALKENYQNTCPRSVFDLHITNVMNLMGTNS